MSTILPLLAVSVLMLAAPVRGQQVAVDAIFSRWDRPDSPGCSVGVVRDGQLVYQRGYGMASLDHAIPLNGKTVFYIASTSKQFTAMSIASLVTQGRLALTDDIRRFVPELPRWEEPVTVGHLVYHTSGIPDFFLLMPLAGRRLEDTASDEDILEMIARQRRLNFRPGDQFQYTNSGYFLLGLIVSRVTGRSLREFAEETFFKPLGMADTRFHDDRTRIVPRRATGYVPHQGGYGIFATLFDRVGDGGLLSTIEDLAKWDRNFYDGGVGGEAMIRLAQTPGRLNDGTTLDYGFGLFLRKFRGLPTVAHGGIYNGFRTELLRFPTRRLSVACLCNLYNIDASRLAQEVADIYLAGDYPEAAAPATPAPALTLASEALQKRIGFYYSPQNGSALRLTLSDGRLLASLPGSGILNQWLAPESESKFRGTNSLRSEFEFTESSDPKVAAIRVRLSPGLGQPVFDFYPAKPVEPTADELAGYAGSYRSEALDITYRIEVKDGRLLVQFRTSPPQPILPTVRDSFSSGGRNFSFNRDPRGVVKGFVLSDPTGRLRGVDFNRAE